MIAADTSRPGALTRRMRAVALSLVLFALVAYWSSLDAEARRPRVRSRRRARGARPAFPEVFVCETLATYPRPTPMPGARLVRFRPSRPRPFELN